MTPSRKAALLKLVDSYHAAMVAAATPALDDILASDFVLVHITGYVQARRDWLDVIRRGQFDYHSIALAADGLAVHEEGTSATVSGRAVVNATIDGSRHPWRLQFTLLCESRGADWRIVHARYGTF